MVVMYFSVLKRMLTFLLTVLVLRRLLLGSVEPEPCLSNALVIVCPSRVIWRGNWRSIAKTLQGQKAGSQLCILLTRGRKCSRQAIHIEAVQTNFVGFRSDVLANMLSNVRFVHSKTALDSGWKTVVRVLPNWSSLVRLVKSLASKLRPWSQ